MKTETITVIIPCFNEEEALPVYYQAMQPVMKQMENIDFELLVIDDGSTDHTLLEMKALHQKDPRCKYFSLNTCTHVCTLRSRTAVFINYSQFVCCPVQSVSFQTERFPAVHLRSFLSSFQLQPY